MIIGISGKIGSGKDTVGKIIQYLTLPEEFSKTSKDVVADITYGKGYCANKSKWQIKKFAGKLKQIVSILTGIPVEDLEKQEVKDRILGEEWCKIVTTLPLESDVNKIIIERNYTNTFFGQTNTSFIVYQKITVRQLLQEVGTDAMRNVIHSNVWVNALFADYNNLCKNKCQKQTLGNPEQCTCKEDCIGESSNWIITDVRFPNELEAVKERKGISIRVNKDFDIKVQHSGKINDFTIEKFDKNNPKHVALKQVDLLNQHPSETALDKATFDYVIENNGTIEELTEKVKQILIKEKII